MSELTLLIATVSLTGSVHALAQSAASEAELPALITDCNAIASSPKPERRSIRACETLAAGEQLALVERAAVIAYQRYREEQREACERRRASPRGASRAQSC